jgi:hypothetical protein
MCVRTLAHAGYWVVHTYNLIYLGGKPDQEDPGLKPDQGNSFRDPITKIPSTKRASRVAQVVNACLISMKP